MGFFELAAELLVRSGCSSNRLERLFTSISKQYECELDVIASPTSVQLMLKKNGKKLHELIRTREWSVDLGLLDRVSAVIGELSVGKLSIAESTKRLRGLDAEPQEYSKFISSLAFGGSSAVLTLLYGAGWLEASVVFTIGFLCHVLISFVNSNDQGRYLSDFLAALFVAFLCKLTANYFTGINELRMITGGIIALLPGLVFLNAIHELAQKNLVSGAAKIFETFIIVMSLSFGVASGLTFADGCLSFLGR